MNELWIALILASVLSLIIGTVEIWQKSDSMFSAIFVGGFFLYLLLILIGNIGSTFLADSLIKGMGGLPGNHSFWAAFVGVFGFEAIIQQLNITLWDNGVLTIKDWITKARDLALAGAVKKQVDLEAANEQDLASKLATIETVKLNTLVSQYLDDETVTDLNSEAENSDADASLLKALALVRKQPTEAKAFLKAHLTADA